MKKVGNYGESTGRLPVQWGHMCVNVSQFACFSTDRSKHDDVIKWKHFRVTGHLCGEFTGRRWIPRTKASDAELSCFLWSALNKRLSKQWQGWWFETPSCPLWLHCNGVWQERLSRRLPTQRAGNSESVFASWRLHEYSLYTGTDTSEVDVMAK